MSKKNRHIEDWIDVDELVRTMFPRPLAVRWSKIVSSESSKKFAQATEDAEDFLESLGRMIAGFLLAQQWALGDPLEQDVVTHLRDTAGHPAVGKWWQLIQMLSKGAHSIENPYFPELKEWYWKPKRGKTEARKHVDSLTAKSAPAGRNRKRHSGERLPPEEHSQTQLKNLRSLLKTLAWLKDYHVVTIHQHTFKRPKFIGEIEDHSGDGSSRKYSWSASVPEAPSAGGVAIVHSQRGILELEPFFSIQKHSRTQNPTLMGWHEWQNFGEGAGEYVELLTASNDGSSRDDEVTDLANNIVQGGDPNRLWPHPVESELPIRNEPLQKRFPPGVQIIGKLGSGGQADVYLIQHERDQKALKILKMDATPEAQKRLRAEIEFYENSARFTHPNIVTGTRVGTALRLEYVGGGDLEKRLNKTIEPIQVRDWALQIVDALEHIHGQDIIHRDIKPSNFLVTQQGDRLQLIDFGLHKNLAVQKEEEPVTRAGQEIGTKGWTPPESRDVAAETTKYDLWAFGKLLLLMLKAGSSRKALEDMVKTSQFEEYIQKEKDRLTGREQKNSDDKIIEETNIQIAVLGLAQTLLVEEPQKRPSFETIKECLSDEVIWSRPQTDQLEDSEEDSDVSEADAPVVHAVPDEQPKTVLESGVLGTSSVEDSPTSEELERLELLVEKHEQNECARRAYRIGGNSRRLFNNLRSGPSKSTAAYTRIRQLHKDKATVAEIVQLQNKVTWPYRIARKRITADLPKAVPKLNLDEAKLRNEVANALGVAFLHDETSWQRFLTLKTLLCGSQPSLRSALRVSVTKQSRSTVQFMMRYVAENRCSVEKRLLLWASLSGEKALITWDEARGHMKGWWREHMLTKEGALRQRPVEIGEALFQINFNGHSLDSFSTEEVLERAVEVTPRTYRKTAIRKSDGSLRWLHEPNALLKLLQGNLARHITKHIPGHHAAMAFIPGRGPKIHAAMHWHAREAVSVDIRDFFGTTYPRHIQPLFDNEFRSPVDGSPTNAGWEQMPFDGWSDDSVAAVKKWLFMYDSERKVQCLPQGAPSSPVVANAAAYPMDAWIEKRLGEVLRGQPWEYSRYADDLVVSSSAPDSDFLQLSEAVLNQAISLFGWTPNRKKTHRWRKRKGGPPLVITGIKVGWSSGELPKSLRRRVRAVLHHVRQGKALNLAAWGLLAHAWSVTGDVQYMPLATKRGVKLVRRLAEQMNLDPKNFLCGWIGLEFLPVLTPAEESELNELVAKHARSSSDGTQAYGDDEIPF